METTCPSCPRDRDAGKAALGGTPRAEEGPPPAGGASGHGRRKRRPAPWKSPFWCVWLVAALLLSGWMTVHMPTHVKRVDAQAAAQHLRESAQRPDAAASGPASTAAPEAKVQSDHKSTSPETIPPEAGSSRTGTNAQSEIQSLAKSEAKPDAVGDSPRMQKSHGNEGAASRLLHRARIFGRLFLYVALGAILGSLIEGRCWYRFLAGTLGRLTRAARLPQIVGAAIPTALASCPAADSMLVASHARGEISRTALVAGGMLNSYLAHVSHSMRVLYPVIAAIGLPGLLYFVIQFSGGAIIIGVVLVIHRLTVRKRVSTEESTAVFDALEHKVQSYSESFRKGLLRAATLLFRIACISVPMILAMEWIIRAGLLNFWTELVPEAVSRHFPEELLTITAAQMGGLVQSSTVSASLLSQGLITPAQVLLAMLVSSAVGNPVRALRRNLPTALGIFSPGTACLIVFGMQFSRLVVTFAGAALVIFWMQMTGAV